MPAASPSAAAPRDTRRAILDAALDLFAEHGFAGTSMRTLARAAGVRESALYHYFESKDALFLGVMEHVFASREGSLAAMFESLGDQPLDEILTRLTDFMVQQMRTPTERKFLRIMMTEGPRLRVEAPDLLRKLVARPRAAAVGFFEELRRRGLVREDVSAEVFIAHFAAPMILVNNLFLEHALLQTPVAEFLRQHVALLVRGLAPDPPARAARPPRPRRKSAG